VNKSSVISEILAKLETELATNLQAAKAAAAAATDGDSKAENKYDTRNLEASYIARGQALRVAELQQAVADFTELAHFPAAGLTVRTGMLVQVETPTGLDHYFIGPSGGGIEVKVDGVEVMVISVTSPLGAKLLQRRIGDTITIRPGWNVQVVGLA
jgi:hypothetical protein